jgi:PIN domain nuclease of toxin-antitoxin system
MLEQKGRIILNTPCIDWIKKALSFGIQIIALTHEIAAESCKLPQYIFGDPADRIIIASARIEGLTIITHDDRILAYASDKLVSAVGPNNN